MSECFNEIFLLNGQFFPCNDFKDDFVSEGNSFYEVIRVNNGACVFLDDHLNRMLSSLALSRSAHSFNNEIFKNYILSFLEKTGLKIGNIKLVVNFRKSKSNVYLYQIKHKYPSDNEYESGVDLGLFFATRRDPKIKYINTELRERINLEIQNTKVYEVLLVNRNNCITEGSRSNVFFIKDGIIYTAADEDVLGGITRKHVINLINEVGIKLIFKCALISSLPDFHACFITGTSPKVLPVKKAGDTSFRVDDLVLRKVMSLYDKFFFEK